MNSTNRIGRRRRSITGGDGIAAKAETIRPVVRPSPIPGYEHVRGYGIYALPFDTGHVLAVRVFPDNDFAPYTTVWHRTPTDRWSIYVDGPRHDTACPRYYGAATDHVQSATIDLTWTGPMTLRVEMESPRLVVTVSMAAPLRATVMNAIGSRLPVPIWRDPFASRVLGSVADAAFDVGDVTFRGTTPNGQDGFLMPRRMYPIVSARATFDGDDLGRPTRAPENPTLGNVRFPARPILAIGEAYFEILDMEEYQRTVAELRMGESGGD